MDAYTHFPFYKEFLLLFLGSFVLYNNLTAAEEKQKVILSLHLPFNLSDLDNERKDSQAISGSNYNTGQFYASAALIAVQDINRRTDLLPNMELELLWETETHDTKCFERKAIESLLQYINNETIDAYIGFVCKCKTVAKMVAAVNKPLFSAGCSEPELSSKDEYPTFARTTSLNADIIQMINTIMKKYRWQKMAILYEKTHMWKSVYDAIRKHITDSGDLEITLELGYDKNEAYTRHYESLHHIFGPFLDELPKKARVVWLLLESGFLRQFLILANKRGFNHGDYVYISVHPFASNYGLIGKNTENLRWILPGQGSRINGEELFFLDRSVLAKAYQSLFILMPKKLRDKSSNRYGNVEQRVKDVIKEPPFESQKYIGEFPFTGDDYNRTRPPPETFRLYDAVMLYALALNKTISNNESISNGSAIIENTKKIRFDSVHGERYMVNSKADLVIYFDLYQFQFTSEEMNLMKKHLYFHEKAPFIPKKVFDLVPDCLNSSCNGSYFQMVPTNIRPLWINGVPPRDEPKCGFTGEKCADSEYTRSVILGVAISITMISVFIIIVPIFLYRNYHLKKILKSQLWKINYESLFFHDWRSASTSSLGSLASPNLTVNYSTMTRQKFTTVAIFKGTLVAVKRIDKRAIELQKTILMELKQIRDIRHDNLNQFIGACVEPNNILIVTQYAPKGSLQDVLENHEIRLNTLFILSLVHDIVKGMCYLHSTDIKSHGNLKSSNCVIDSRWVLKITDFGLNMFRSKQGTLNSIESELHNNLLWKSPELLRLNMPATSRGSQKGDVYSFAIILQECHTRDGAWGSSFQDPEVIVEKVKARVIPAFRPVVSVLLDGAEGLRDVMKRCWNENPEERPHFSELRKDVEAMMKVNGLKTNIFDNMVYMMGKYSDDLEEMVEERTSSLIEEKHKVEALLERMLPKSVARQLMKGKAVEAESFEEVTIYFSDIVGFTTICSSISPMEVVNLLNSLYTMFDNVTKSYDVYKVETIGDAYMVVSGLPVRNGKEHAKEIALLALDILENIRSFKVKPKQEQLEVRIGIHSGPVVAGVVGTAMPRYCLFGDTVNVASRMESHGQALRIHISPSVKDDLTSFGGFNMQSRGLTEIKGKGKVETFWLLGADQYHIRKRTSNLNETRHTLKDILRDSPRVRHKLHLTPEYLRRTPTGSSIHHFRHNNKSNGSANLIPPACKRKSNDKGPKGTQVELIDFHGHETETLLRPRNGTFSGVGASVHSSHREISFTMNLKENSPKPL